MGHSDRRRIIRAVSCAHDMAVIHAGMRRGEDNCANILTGLHESPPTVYDADSVCPVKQQELSLLKATS